MEEIIKLVMEQNAKITELLEHKTSDKSSKVGGLNFEKYDENVEDFNCFIERFKSFMDLQDIPKEKRANALISSLSAKLYNLLKSLIAPQNASDKTFDELVDVLKKHLSPKPLIIPSRHAFLNRKQAEGESISSYIAELRSLAVSCCYPESMLNTMLRDVFVSGLRSKMILDRIFEEDDTDLEKTIAIAIAMEKAVLGANEIMGVGKQLGINAVKTTKKLNYNKSFIPKQTAVNIQSNNKFCTRCGKSNHTANMCRYKNTTCNYCKKKGHLAVVCFKAKNATKNKKFKQLKMLETSVNDEIIDAKETNDIVPLHGVNIEGSEELKSRSPILIPVKIEGIAIKMELDTGAAVSAMSFRKFRKMSKKKIQPTKLIFKTYKGEMMVPLGYVLVEAEYKGQIHTVKLYIVKENVDTVFGREWLYKFKIDWTPLKQVKEVKISPVVKHPNLAKLLEEYKELFKDDLGEIKNYECKLELKPETKPIFLRPRVVPFALKQRVEKEIENLEAQGIIEKVEFSDWATPVVPVVKTDGNIRLCADYSLTINPNLLVPQHPLPKLEEIFSCLNGGKHFSKIDFSKAYLQMKVHPDTEKLLTINTHKGLYRCKRLMYGINAAPAIWQKFVETIFQDLPGVKVFMDDARITGPDDTIHLERLKLFFERCKKYGLRINLKKSKFFQDEINFLGHKINSHGLHKTEEKVKAILDAPQPKDVQEVKSFLGLVHFYGKFCQNLSTLAYPLYNLTKKDVKFDWTPSCQEAFQNIKKEICSNRILMHYDPELPLVLATDASSVGIGAVLSHRLSDDVERPISFASRTLSQAEQKYSQIDKEALSISWAVKKFYLYLKGRKFILITDHKPLVSIFGPKKGLPLLTATRLLHYALQLQAFEFDIEYRNTKENSNADCLSRLPLKSSELHIKDEVEIFQMSQIETLPITFKDLKRESGKDEELRFLINSLKFGGKLKGREAEYSLHDGCVMYGQRVCIPKCFQRQVLEELHYGHLGVVKMKAIARSYVYWKGIDNDIEEIAKNCTECFKHKINPPKSKVHYWEYPCKPWERIHIDFAGPIFEHMFLIIVDAHSKWMEVYPLKKITSSITIDCLRECFSRYGIPITLVSDNGPQLTSVEFETFLRLNGIKHITCAPFNPSSNGQAERYVFTLKQSLRALKNYPGNINRRLGIFLMQYRKAPNLTTSHSPSMLFLGREIRTRIDLLTPNLKNRVEEKLRRNQISFHDRVFNTGDKVAVRNYNAANAKWSFGTIVNRDGLLHYTINLNGRLIRRHIDQIREAGDNCYRSENFYVPRVASYARKSLAESSPTVSTPVLSQTTELHGSPNESSLEGSSNYEEKPVQQHKETEVPTSVQVSSPCEKTSTPSVFIRRSTRIRRPPNRLNL